jgi:hypothetical protein
MTGYTAEELEIVALIERMQDCRLTAAEAAIALAQAFAIGELSEPLDDTLVWDVMTLGGKPAEPYALMPTGADKRCPTIATGVTFVRRI